MKTINKNFESDNQNNKPKKTQIINKVRSRLSLFSPLSWFFI